MDINLIGRDGRDGRTHAQTTLAAHIVSIQTANIWKEALGTIIIECTSSD
jgi:hypothetical protein